MVNIGKPSISPNTNKPVELKPAKKIGGTFKQKKPVAEPISADATNK